jgi:hypothetical protein
MTRRFPLRMGPVLAYGRLVFFAGRSTSYVELDDEMLTARMGRVTVRVRRADIGAITRETWPYYFFSGWRLSWITNKAVFGAPGPVVHIETLRPRFCFASFPPALIRHIFLSVEDVNGLVKAIGPRPRPPHDANPRPRSRGWVPLQ